MKNFDLKAIGQLMKLKELFESDPDRFRGYAKDKVTEMLAKYDARAGGVDNAGFFTSGERKRLIKQIYRTYFYEGTGMPKQDPWPDSDRRLRDTLADALKADAVPPIDVNFVTSLLETCGRFWEGPSPRMRTALKKNVDRVKNYPFQKSLYQKLRNRRNIGQVFVDKDGNFDDDNPSRQKSLVFCDSVLAQFEHGGFWSVDQQEPIEDILNRNVKKAKWQDFESLMASQELAQTLEPF